MKNFLVISGPPGCGKTYLCSAFIDWVHSKTDYRYFSERDFLSRVRSSMGNTGGDYIQTVRYQADANFLMLDDMGSSGFNEWRQEVLLELIDYRYESQKPTLFTTNFNRQGLLNGLGERAMSRLFSIENTIVEMPEAIDLRQVKF